MTTTAAALVPQQGGSETKFTPGPWEVRHRLNSVGAQNKGGRYVILQAGSSLREDFYICEMPFAACRAQDEREHEANAHLIAAAPTMYEYIASSASAGCATAQKILDGIHGSSRATGAAS